MGEDPDWGLNSEIMGHKNPKVSISMKAYQCIGIKDKYYDLAKKQYKRLH